MTVRAKDIPQEFIDEHIKNCHHQAKSYKRLNPKPVGEHQGKGKYLRRSKSKRQCAIKLYRDCIRLGITPTPYREEFNKQLEIKES